MSDSDLQYVMGGNRQVMLAVIEKYPHLLACKFCHRQIIHINSVSPDFKDILAVMYECKSFFLMEKQTWVQKCHWMSWLTLPLRKGARYILIRILLLLQG